MEKKNIYGSTDIFTSDKRSKIMANVRSKNTKPEIIVRSLLHKQGFRFRLHDTKLPGHPDIVLKKFRTVVFINGCFWHQHEACKKATLPKQNSTFWITKLQRNVERDKEEKLALEKVGWKVIVVWECETKRDLSTLLSRLKQEITSSIIEA